MASSVVCPPRARLSVCDRERVTARTPRPVLSSWFTQSISWSSPELLFAPRVFLDQSVGEAEDAVSAFQTHLADLWLRSAQADRECRGGGQPTREAVVANEHRQRVSRIDPLHASRGRVQPHHLRGDEVVRTELLCHSGVHEGIDLRQPGSEAAGVAVGADGHGGHGGRVQTVPHRVDHGHVEDVVVERVVEAVARHVVGGFQDSGHGDARHDHGQRRQQRPLDLGGDAHRFTAPGMEEQVGVAVFGHQQVGHQAGEPAQHAAVVVIDAVQRHGHDAHLVAAVQQRQVDPYAVVLGQFDRQRVEEAAPGGRVVDHLRVPAREALAGQGYEQQLAIVLRQHLRTAAPQPLHDAGDQRPDEMGRKRVRAIENHTQQRFPEALGAVRTTPGCHSLTRHDPCVYGRRGRRTKGLPVSSLHHGPFRSPALPWPKPSSTRARMR